MRKMAVVGCHGLLGQNLVNSAVRDYEVLGVDLAPASFLHLDHFRYFSADITRRETLEELRRFNPQVVVNCAAYTAVDGAEKEKDLCWRVNVDGVANLLSVLKSSSAHFLQISTDYIFDGRNGPYREEDAPHPLGVYGKSKLAAENLVRGAAIPTTVLRTMVLFGKGIRLKTDFVGWVQKELSAGHDIRVVEDQIGNATYARELVRAILAAAQRGVSGILHAASRDILSRYELARLVAELFALDAGLIHPVSTAELGQAAPRPLQSGLLVSHSEEQLGIRFLTVREVLEEYRSEILNTYRLN